MLILASKSPRRAEILGMLGYSFEIHSSEADESSARGLPPREQAAALAELKARALGDTENIIIGADTLVALDGQIFGKPSDEADAARMLSTLSGRTHSVFTGVCVLCGDRCEVKVCESRVTFYRLSKDEIDRYISTGEPMDKAGAYGAQGRGSVLVRRIDGDFFTVMGLPAAVTAKMLARFGAVPSV